MDGDRDGDPQAATPRGGQSGEHRNGRQPGEGQAAEEARARQVTAVDRPAVLAARLELEAANGFTLETRSATQAVIARSRRRWHGVRASSTERQVLSVDENGNVTARAAEPMRW